MSYGLNVEMHKQVRVTSLNFDLLSASTQANSSGMGVKSCSRGDNYVNQEYVKHSYSVM